MPVIDLAEVSAGGGSIAWVDPAGSLRVGPKVLGQYPDQFATIEVVQSQQLQMPILFLAGLIQLLFWAATS